MSGRKVGCAQPLSAARRMAYHGDAGSCLDMKRSRSNEDQRPTNQPIHALPNPICSSLRPYLHLLPQSRVNRRLARPPLPHNVCIPERHHLARNHARDALLAVAPPEEIGDAGPPGRVFASARCAGFLGDHEGEAPALWRVAFLGVESAECQCGDRRPMCLGMVVEGTYSGAGFVCSGFAAGIPWRAKSG